MNKKDKIETEVASGNSVPAICSAADEIEENSLFGVQPMNHRHKVLFTERVEIKTSELKKWKPTIVINPYLFDDDE